MPIAIEIDPDGVAVATCRGVLGLHDAQRAAAALWETPGWAGRAVVWDFREAQFDVSAQQTREIARFILQYQPDPPPERVAFVTARDVDFGMARMFEVFREDPATGFRVFRDYGHALAWIRAGGSAVA